MVILGQSRKVDNVSRCGSIVEHDVVDNEINTTLGEVMHTITRFTPFSVLHALYNITTEHRMAIFVRVLLVL